MPTGFCARAPGHLALGDFRFSKVDGGTKNIFGTFLGGGSVHS